jgi:hypothetical protein
MGIIIKMKQFYMEYSTVCDAPSRGMTKEQIKHHLISRHGAGALTWAIESIVQVDRTGTSDENQSLRDVLFLNRAGRDETILTAKQIYDYYCVNQCNGVKPLGVERIDKEVYFNKEGEDHYDPTIDESGQLLF